MKIKKIQAVQILDSRGVPTVECTIQLDDDFLVSASVPSGSSVGRFEALELRDNDQEHFSGEGVLQAVENVNERIAPLFVGKRPDIQGMDRQMIEFDGTANKSELGANATLAVSIALVRAQAHMQDVHVFELLHTLFGVGQIALPQCMFNIINGGKHADSGLLFQEFMVMPKAGLSVTHMLEQATSIYGALKILLKQKGYRTSIGDEGGFAPRFEKNSIDNEREALDMLLQAIEGAGLENEGISICIDVAAAQFYDVNKKRYVVYGQEYVVEQMVEMYQKLLYDYPIVSIEDGLGEDDWQGWQHMTQMLAEKVQLVGDDVFVTNVDRIKKGITSKAANAVLIKPNQIGTVSETVAAIACAQKAGYTTIVSHRSGETCDSFIADLAVGTGSQQLKAGAPIRSERVEKYNRLLEIERVLKESKN